ncbi:MAG: hypothetical protein M3Y04_05035 [Actinomycetota bacterium]|nr:hypothetical protein [Actinomycetota bacterium]
MPVAKLASGWSHQRGKRHPLRVTSQTLTTRTGPPSGRFVATYVPAGLVQVGEKELAKVAVGLPNPGRFRSWTAPPTGGQPVHLNASWISDAPTLDVDAEVARYVGARRVEIQGQPALFLPQLSARPAPVLAWQPLPGQMVTVSGTAVADDDVLATAQGLRVPELEASSLPTGFDPVPQSSEMAQPVPVPRRYSLYYGVGGSPDAATALTPQPTGPALSISARWGEPLAPAAPSAGEVRGHPAVAPPQGPDQAGTVALAWIERGDLQVQMSASGIDETELRRVAEGLRERSAAEVLAQDSTAAVASATAGGTSYTLRTSTQPGCLQLIGDGNRITAACGFDPGADGVSVLVSAVAKGDGPSRPVVVGLVRADAAGMRVVFPDGNYVAGSVAPAAAGSATTLYAVEMPQAAAVAAVVAVDRAGTELARHSLLAEFPGAPLPPWAAPRLAPADVAPTLLAAWGQDSKGQGCAALALTAIGPGSGAAARVANFGPGAWAVAFDKAGLPGTDADGKPSPDSGRSAYGVAGTSLDIVVAHTGGWTAHKVWADGSRADYGPDGGAGTVWMADLYVRGQRCLYNVWSALGREHLEQLLDGIRMVSGTP